MGVLYEWNGFKAGDLVYSPLAKQPSTVYKIAWFFQWTTEDVEVWFSSEIDGELRTWNAGRGFAQVMVKQV